MNDRKITDIASVIDSLHSTPEYSHEGFPMVRVVDVNNEFIKLEKCFKVEESTFHKHNKNHAPQKGDLIITRVGSFGLLGYVDSDKKFCLGQNIAIIHPKINSKFLYYYLLSPYIQSIIHGNIGGSAYKSISLADIRNLPYNDINLDVDKIGNLLYSLDAKIELNNRINSELEAMAKTLYDYWFVQFEFPIEAATAAKMGDPGLVGKPYKTSGGKMVWNDELKREIPEGWEVKEIGEVAIVKAGGDKPENYTIEKTETNNVPIYSNGITNDGLYGYTSKSIINEQSITISARGTIGFCVLRNKPFVPIIRLISLIPNLKGSAKYFYEALKNFIFENSGSVQQQLTVPQVTRIKILYPNEDVLKKYDEVTSPMIERVEFIQKENQKITKLRDWLLPMLMNGQVKVV